MKKSFISIFIIFVLGIGILIVFVSTGIPENILRIQDENKDITTMNSSLDSKASISAQLLLADNSGTFAIQWGGAKNTDLLVISFDSKEALESRPMQLEPNSTGLFGIVLVRSIQEAHSTTLMYQYRDLIRYFNDEHIVIRAYLVSALDLLLMAGDRSVMGGEYIRGQVKITGKDALPKFQLVCPDDEDIQISTLFPTAARLSTKAIEGMRCSAALRKDSIQATATVEW